MPQKSQKIINKMPKNLINFTLGLLTVSLTVGCSTTNFNESRSADSGWDSSNKMVDSLPQKSLSDLALTSSLNTLKFGDTVELDFYRADSLDGFFSIDRDGTINFPLIGSVYVAGMTTGQLQNTLEERYSNQLLKNPSISVKIEQSVLGKLVVDGAVNEPGVFEIFDIVSMSEAIALAGGTKLEADQDNVFLVRDVDGEQKIQRVNLEDIRKRGIKGPNVYPNDIIYVQNSNVRLAYNEFIKTLPLFTSLIFAASR